METFLQSFLYKTSLTLISALYSLLSMAREIFHINVDSRDYTATSLVFGVFVEGSLLSTLSVPIATTQIIPTYTMLSTTKTSALRLKK